MWKNYRVLLGLGLAFICIGGWVFMRSANNKLDGEFSVLDYESIVNDFQFDFQVSNIDSVREAKIQAKKVWINMYGEKVKNYRPYKVYYDEHNQAWLIEGTLSDHKLGGVPNIIILSDGTVKAVWHTR